LLCDDKVQRYRSNKEILGVFSFFLEERTISAIKRERILYFLIKFPNKCRVARNRTCDSQGLTHHFPGDANGELYPQGSMGVLQCVFFLAGEEGNVKSPPH